MSFLCRAYSEIRRLVGTVKWTWPNSVTLCKAYCEIQRLIGDELTEAFGGRKESFRAVKAVEKHRRYWKPAKVRVLLLAESHVFTSDADLKSITKYRLKGCPEEYVRLVYCLGYGENDLADVANNSPGTPQYWKAFVSSVNPPDEEHFRQVQKSHTRNLDERITNKVSTLYKMKQRGIWLVDASIVALYPAPNMPPKIRSAAIRISWKHHISRVIRSANPDKIIVIGHGVEDALYAELKETGIPFCSIKQPNAFMTSEERDLYHKTIHCLCSE